MSAPRENGGAAELTAAWVYRHWINLTVRVDRLDPAALSNCRDGRATCAFRAAADEGRDSHEEGAGFAEGVDVLLRFGRVQLIHAGYYAGESPMPRGVFMNLHGERYASLVEGQPWFVRLSYDRGAWTGSGDPSRLRFDIGASCEREEPTDAILRSGVGVPSVSTVLVAVTFGGNGRLRSAPYALDSRPPTTSPWMV